MKLAKTDYFIIPLNYLRYYKTMKDFKTINLFYLLYNLKIFNFLNKVLFLF